MDGLTSAEGLWFLSRGTGVVALVLLTVVVVLVAVLYGFHLVDQFVITDPRFALGGPGDDSSLKITGAAHAVGIPRVISPGVTGKAKGTPCTKKFLKAVTLTSLVSGSRSLASPNRRTAACTSDGLMPSSFPSSA